MISKVMKYRQKIQKSINRIILFPHMEHSEIKPAVTHQCDIKLPSSHPIRSSQQIENNITIIHHITQQSSKQSPTTLHTKWPKACIGLILCEHNQNNQTFYVYGTGILIHSKIVLTSAQNVYCRRLNKQYTNIRFIVGVSDDKCSGIYDVKRIHYPKEYTMQEYENYNFAVVQLNDDLSNRYGYVGWKIIENINVELYKEYRYTSDNKQGSFNLEQRNKHKKSQGQDYQGSGVLIKENKNKYFIVGLKHSQRKLFLSEKIRSKINQWTEFTTVYLYLNKIGAQGCKYLSQVNLRHLIKIDLSYNSINEQGCKYLSQANWVHLTQVSLGSNNINAQGCKYLIQANWKHLTRIDLYNNKIGAQGCKYLSQTNWKHLTTISFEDNMIVAQGCKYLSDANWIHLTTIYLARNNIGEQGCKYLSQANWKQLTRIALKENSVQAQGCKYLSQANWKHLTSIQLYNNNIEDIVYRLLLLQLYTNDIMKI